MQEVIFIIGLPGSGKSTLIEHYKSHPFIDYKIYDDWMEWTLNDIIDKDFASDVNYSNLIQDIKSGNNVIVSTIRFCLNEFLHKSEYYLKSQFPDLNIKRIYFENDPVKSELNIRYRDKINGGYWEPNEEGVMWYFGTIFENIPLYRIEIQHTKDLSPNYIIPKGSTIFPIVVQQTDS